MDQDYREPVHYKLLPPERLDDALRFQCTLCLENRSSGYLVSHAAIRHGITQFTVDTRPPEING